jgi:hypothetical protein
MVGVVLRGANVTRGTVGDRMLTNGADDGWYVMDMDMDIEESPDSWPNSRD